MKLVILSFALFFVLCQSQPQPQPQGEPKPKGEPHAEPHGEPHAEPHGEPHTEPHSEPKTEPHAEPESKGDHKNASHSHDAAAEGEPLAPKKGGQSGNGASKFAINFLPFILVPLLML